MTKEQLKKAGIAARHLLEFAWANQSVYLNLIRSAITGVCKTFESDPQTSEELLRKIIEPEHLKEKGYEELFALGQELKRLISLAPEFVRDTYIAAFGCHEQPEGAVRSGGSISALIIPHKQAYENNLFMLAHSFPEFIKEAPEEATKTVVPIMREYVKGKEDSSLVKPRRSFSFLDRTLYIKPDNSFVWDESLHFEDEEITILRHFFAYLRQLCEKEETDLLRRLIGIILDVNDLAVIWKRLLELAAIHPTTLGKLLLPLAWAKPILEEPDTCHAVGEFIRVIHPDLTKEEKTLIEHAIRSLPECAGGDHKEYLEYTRSRLLSCLSPENIAEEETKKLREKLEVERELRSNEPLFKIGQVTSTPYTVSDFLKERGVPIDDPKHAQILELSKPLTQFSKDFLNEIPGKEDAEKIFPALKEFHTALIEASESGIKEDLLNQGWDCLADACANITKMEGLSCKEVLGQFVKRVLLEASNNSVPEYDEFEAKQFDRNQGICKPAPRVEAALGLIRFGRFKDCLDDKVLEVIYVVRPCCQDTFRVKEV